jgi:5-deoxy-glucuronate isomerase
MPEYYLPAGSTADENFSVAITPESADWAESSLWILNLAADEEIDVESGDDEIIILPLAGSATVTCDGTRVTLRGRASVFDGPTDFAYVGRDSTYSIETDEGGRFALCGARAERRLPFRYVEAADVAVELRGAGNCSRQIHNFGSADAFEADALIACEVLTPGGNWSSYPAHKHDTESETESALEEIYYFEIADGVRGQQDSDSTASTAHPSGRSTSSPRSAAATLCSSPTATTDPRSRPPATTCTTST